MQINLFFEHLNPTPLKIHDKFFYFNIKKRGNLPIRAIGFKQHH
ncbi:hypothetical protein HMPREF1419_00442 [Helicobacter pylori GAM263BFi]|nr:hypothetical protein HMPREF1419_00442 [Helicobacter pylori GAM263BFi]